MQRYQCTISIILMVMFIMMRWYEIHQHKRKSNGMRHAADDDCRGEFARDIVHSRLHANRD